MSRSHVGDNYMSSASDMGGYSYDNDKATPVSSLWSRRYKVEFTLPKLLLFIVVMYFSFWLLTAIFSSDDSKCTYDVGGVLSTSWSFLFMDRALSPLTLIAEST